MRILEFLIQSNIYISLAAVLLALSTRIQLGLSPQWQPYLFILFFATLLEYNLHRLVSILSNRECLNSEKHRWVKDHLMLFYGIVALSFAGFIAVLYLANRAVLMILSPVALVTLLYSVPFLGLKAHLFRIRQIPYLKIFLIALVWTYVTILLPAYLAGKENETATICWMMMERFLFIFAVALPFDIRDMDTDKISGLSTIPMLVGAHHAMVLSCLALLGSGAISMIHYYSSGYPFISVALMVSCLSTFLLLTNHRLKRWPYYYHGLLDGALLLQGILVLSFYFLSLV